jgi:sugar phosphate isomerase/epimerase
MNPRVAFSSNAFRKHSLCDTIRILSDIGYDGLEIMADVPHAYPPNLNDARKAEIKAALQETGLAISNVNAFMLCAIQDFQHPSWIEADPARRELRVQHTINCIELAQELGAKTISTQPGGPLEGMRREQAMELFLEGIARVTPIAKAAGVKVLVEPEPELLIENADQFLDFIRRVDTEAIGLNFDVGHFYCVGNEPWDTIPRLREYIGHFHVEDIAASREHFHMMLGEGSIDFSKVLGAMRDIGYDGFVTIELYPYLTNAPEVAKRAFQYIKHLM